MTDQLTVTYSSSGKIEVSGRIPNTVEAIAEVDKWKPPLSIHLVQKGEWLYPITKPTQPIHQKYRVTINGRA